MSIADPMLLPSDVELVPVETLPPELLAQVEHKPGDHALTRPRSRTPSIIVDAGTAKLLESFRVPTRIVDAVLAYAANEERDARETLDRSYPILRGLLEDGLLVSADSPFGRPIEQGLREGDRVGRFTISRLANLMIDTELYIATGDDREPVALKVSRSATDERMRRLIAREAEMLRLLDGTVTPSLLEVSEFDDRPYLATSWLSGIDLESAARDVRRLGVVAGPRALLELGGRVIDAYARLHAQGVLHGDVHPSNLLVGPDGAVSIIDFGLAAPIDARSRERGGVDFFLEPEAASERAHRLPSPLTAEGEQYAVAAIVYFALTGAHTHNFSLEPTEMLRQLSTDPVLPFSTHGVADVRHVEGVLGRALAKAPTERFADVTAFLRAFQQASRADLGEDRKPSPEPNGQLSELMADVLARVAPSGPLLDGSLEAPTATVNLGAAGIAYAVLRIAMARNDPRLLALADIWSARAVSAIGTKIGFENEALEITPDRFGSAGIHHSAAGVFVVDATVAAARGDELTQSARIAGFIDSAGIPRESDVSFGKAGALIGAAMLVDGAPPIEVRSQLIEHGDRLATALVGDLARFSHVAHDPASADPLYAVGAAHGWAGMLFALLRWAECTGTAPPIDLEPLLSELASLATPLGRGVYWPQRVGMPDDPSLAATWCNGAAGHVPLWLLAADRCGNPQYRRLAAASAWTAYDMPDGPGDLCCGLAGRAYGLLAIYRSSGSEEWLVRARDLAERAVQTIRAHALRRDSLYKGELGVAVLAADLSDPGNAAMPFFHREI
jgi:eukaryotic-like serine/threonine-protein kinase